MLRSLLMKLLSGRSKNLYPGQVFFSPGRFHSITSLSCSTVEHALHSRYIQTRTSFHEYGVDVMAVTNERFAIPRNCKISFCDLTRDVLTYCLVPDIDIVRVFFLFCFLKYLKISLCFGDKEFTCQAIIILACRLRASMINRTATL